MWWLPSASSEFRRQGLLVETFSVRSALAVAPPQVVLLGIIIGTLGHRVCDGAHREEVVSRSGGVVGVGGAKVVRVVFDFFWLI